MNVNITTFNYGSSLIAVLTITKTFLVNAANVISYSWGIYAASCVLKLFNVFIY